MVLKQVRLIIGIFLISLFSPCLAGEVDPHKEYRVALVIGNSSYKDSPLKNPSNDAKDIADALQDLGFEVVFGTNLNKQQIRQKVSEFRPMLKKADVGFFYFAGHGLQYKGVNYLVPISYDINNESEITTEALATNSILKQMDNAGNAVNIVILDACRNNPFAGSYQVAKRNLKKPDISLMQNTLANVEVTRGLKRSSSTGLSRIDGPSGSLIAFATAPGNVAADGKGKNGLYTLHLLEYMNQPGLSIEHVFKKVRIGVMKDTSGKQIPWENSSLLGDFYFIEPDSSKDSSSSSLISTKKTNQGEINKLELEFWKSVEKSKSAALYSAYLKKYPQGYFVEIAQIKLDAMSTKTANKTSKEVQVSLTRENITIGKKVAANAKNKSQSQPIAIPGTSNNLFSENNFVNIKPGCFTMGSPFGEEARQNDELDHEVCINKSFMMGKYEVTQEQWKHIMGYNPAYFKGCGSNCPVERVSWNDVQEFISRLNRVSEKKYRLPTEAEWEYVARANTSSSTYTGNIEQQGSNNAPDLDEIAWYSGNSEALYKGGKYCDDWEDKQFQAIRCGTQEVGKKQPNLWGLYDMIGNVWELTEDWYGSYSSRVRHDPKGKQSGDLKVARGGNWADSLQQNRAAARYGFAVKERSNNLGFRLVVLD
jgi:formylglycine-generating enzyme required for sulfatase activity